MLDVRIGVRVGGGVVEVGIWVVQVEVGVEAVVGIVVFFGVGVPLGVQVRVGVG